MLMTRVALAWIVSVGWSCTPLIKWGAFDLAPDLHLLLVMGSLGKLGSGLLTCYPISD